MKPMQWRHALCSSGLDPTARLVAHVVGVYMNGAGESWPDKESIRDGAGLKSVRSVDAAILRIERAGYITVIRSKGGRKSNHYFADTPQHRAGLADEYPASERRIPRRRTSNTPQPRAGEIDEVVEVGDTTHAPDGRASSVAITDSCLKCGDEFTTTDSADAYCAPCRATENGAAPAEELVER